MYNRLLMLSLLMLLFSCGNEANKALYTIGFSQCTGGDKWREMMHEEMKRELAFHPEVELIIKDAQGDNKLQKTHIEEFIEERVDVLIISPNEAAPVTPPIEAAFNQDIPVIIVDRRTASKSYTAYVGADNFEIGKTAGNYAANLLKGKGKIIEIWGLEGSTPAQNRHAGFVDAISKYADIQIIKKVNGEWEKAIAKQRLPKILKKNPDADLVFAHNDVMALAAYEVAQNLSVNPHLKFIGVDALPGPNGGIQFVADGMLDATFLYPTGGEDAIRLAIDILEGKVVDKENVLETTVVDASNVRVMQLQTNRIINQQKNIERQQLKIQEQNRLYRSQRIVMWGILAILIATTLTGAFILSRQGSKYERNQRQDEQALKPTKTQQEKPPTPVEIPPENTPTPDEIFLQKLNNIIEENIANSELNVEHICRQLGMSRIQVYRKIKSLLGCGVNDHIKAIRLEKAKKLLRGGNHSVSEIAYQTGFSSPAYFSTAFKTKYKISPSEVKK